MQKLIIEDQEVFVDSSYCIRWVETTQGISYPVLYKNGKRIVKKWGLKFDFESPEDPFGGNANTN